MSTHETVIHQLLKLQEEATPRDALLSLYLPIGAKLERDLKVELHALIIANLRAYDESREYTTAHQRVAKYLTNRVTELDPLPRHLGLFARVPLAQLDQAATKDWRNLLTYTIVPLTSGPVPTVFIGQVFDLRPLFQLDRKSIHALVVILNKDQGQLNQLVDSQLIHDKTIENIWSYLGEDETQMLMTMGTAGQIMHGAGYENVKRRQQSGNHMVLNELTKVLRPYLTPANTWKQIVILASADFNEVIASWLPELQKFTSIKPIVSTFLPGTDHELIAKALELIHEHQRTELHDLYDQYQQEYQQWAKGWDEVTEAVRKRQVDKLLITPQATHDGYVVYNELPYTSPEAQSQHVHNLAPWLTKIVYQSHGDVIASNQLPTLYHEPIMARLRYRPR